MAAAEPSEGLRHAAGDGGVGDADDLPVRAGRVGERAEDVEHGSDPDFAARPGGEAHGRVESLGEHESEAGSLDAGRHRLGRERYLDAERFQYIG